MAIWIDADACPKPLREIVTKAATRTQTKVTFVSNHSLPLQPSEYVTSVTVAAGFDVADNYIVQASEAKDMVVTQDIPLAAELIEKGVEVIGLRGEIHTKDTIRQRLNMRDFMSELRDSGIQTGCPAAYNAKDKQLFSNALDRYLARQK